MKNPKKDKISIIIPVYFNEGELLKTFSEIYSKVILTNSSKKFEIIFIDDGSGDNSFNELLEIKKQNPKIVKLVKLTRNFGQAQAILAGYHLAKGDCVINISADLQDPPELMNEMIAAYYNEGYEIVIGIRKGRDENLLRKSTSKFFYSLMRKLSFPNMPSCGFDYALLSKKVVKTIFSNPEADFFWQGSIIWTGFKIKMIPYNRSAREIGKSRWTFSKKITALFDGMIAYSYAPIRFMTFFGILISFGSFLYALDIVIAWYFNDIPFKGWAPLMILVLLLSGFQMIMLGLIGEYLWRALNQVRNRPHYIIDKIYE